MVRRLLIDGWDVTGIDVNPAATEMWQLLRSSNIDPTTYEHRLSYIQWDARSYFNSLYEAKFDLVVHCAYRVGGRVGIDGINDNFIHNVQLDASLFNWAIRARPRHIVYFSSSAVYPVEFQTIQYAERLEESLTIPMDDRSPDSDTWYGWAKYVGECLVENARLSDVNVSVFRPFSGYGTDQGTEYPFRAFIDRAKNRENPFVIWGSSHQVRDWIHIDDIIEGVLTIVRERPDDIRPINLCTGLPTAMCDLVLKIAEQVGYDPTIQVDATKPMGVAYRVGDPQRMHETYAHTISLDEGIRRALEGIA